jgi:uncharacterized protein YggE
MSTQRSIRPRSIRPRSIRPRSIRRPATLVGAFALALGAVFATTTPAWARTGGQHTGAGSGTTNPAAEQSRTIVATGTARVRGTPDVLTVTLGVNTRGHSVGEALDRNNSAARKVIAVLYDGGVDKKDVQTTNFSINPIYGDNANDIEGYMVSNLVVAQLRELDKAGSILDKAAEAGGNDAVVRGVSFDIDDTSDLIATARADAVKRARNQAEQLAAAAGVQLGDVLTISESSRDYGPVTTAPSAGSDEAVAQMRVALESGSEELTVQVSVVFSIR